MKDILILALIPFVVGCAITQAQTVKQESVDIAPQASVLHDEASEQNQEGMSRSHQQSSNGEARRGSLASHGGQPAQQQCYKLVPVTHRLGSPDRSKMCHALRQVLNSSCDEGPMVCGVHFPPNSGFSTPDWRPLNLNQNMDLIEKLVRGTALRLERFNPGVSDRVWADFEAALQDDSDEAAECLAVSDVDVMNRGRAETVYRLTTSSCAAAKKQTFKLDPVVFLARDAEVLSNQVWHERAERGEPPFPGADVWDWFPVDLFEFEGITYEFRWSPEPWVRELSWHVIKGFDEPIVGMSTVCQFEYVGNND